MFAFGGVLSGNSDILSVSLRLRTFTGQEIRRVASRVSSPSAASPITQSGSCRCDHDLLSHTGGGAAPNPVAPPEDRRK